MSYIEENLMNGEKILYRSKLSGVVFLWPLIWFIVAIMIFGSGGDFAGRRGGLFVLIAIVTGIYSYINYTTSEYWNNEQTHYCKSWLHPKEFN
jgi:hypothetical protein